MSTVKEITEVILEIKRKHPELRVGQIIANAVRYAGYARCDPFFVEDEDLLQALQETGENYR